MSIEEFKQSLESVENKDRFLEHLKTRENADERLELLNLVEPILREPHIEIFIKDKDGAIKKEYIKAFKDENKTHLYMLITQDNDTILRTFIPKLNERYMRSHVRDADIIHSFIQPNRTAKSDNALSDVVVYENNPTTKPLNSQEDLLKNTELNNETTPKPTHLSPLELANAKKLLKLQRAITPLKEFGTNYPEFALKPKEALEKLLQEKNGQVAGAAYREDLGGIDFVWGTPKTKDSNGYGLAHILEKREKQYKRLGLTNEQAKERTKELLRQIPEVIEKGIKDNDYVGHVTIRHNGIKVGLSSQKGNTPLKNHYMITSFETDEKVLRELETIATLSNDYRDGINYSASNLNEPNPTTNTIKTQEPSREQANAKKLLNLQRAITPLKEFGTNYPEFALKPKEALEKLLQEKNGQVAGAAYRENLGGIDFVWGNKHYGLEHILKRREEQALNNGLNEAEAKEYAINVVKSIPEIIEKGVKVDNNGRIAIEYKHMRVGLNDKWDNQNLENKWVISSYEVYNSESGLPFRPIAQLQEVGLEPSKLTEPNPTTNTIKTQEPLSPLEQANAKKLLNLQHATTPLKEFGTNYPEFALKPKEALEKLFQEKNGQVAGAAYRDDLGGIDFVWGKGWKRWLRISAHLRKERKTIHKIRIKNRAN